MLNIIACVKVVTDPEAPASTFSIDPEGQRAIPGPGIPPVLNPYDENCLEAALRLKEAQEVKITVVSLGGTLPKAVVRKCLAVGADELVLLEDAAFAEVDGYTTAYLLAEAIKKIGAYDLILTGRMAADTNAGQVGTGIAEMLGLPAVTVARKIEVADGTAKIEQSTADGYRVLECPLPCLVTVSHELGEMRPANIKGLMAAQKQPLTVWKAADLGVDVSPEGKLRRLKLFIPSRDVECEFIGGDSPEQAAASLAEKITGLKVKR